MSKCKILNECYLWAHVQTEGDITIIPILLLGDQIKLFQLIFIDNEVVLACYWGRYQDIFQDIVIIFEPFQSISHHGAK